MPVKQPENLQLCTFLTATDLAAKLIAIGISVGTIYEIEPNGEKHDTTQENWEDSGENRQYVAKIWGGPEQSLGITNAMFEEKGYTYEAFTKLAAVSNKTPPEPAIVALKGNVEAISRNLTHQMRE